MKRTIRAGCWVIGLAFVMLLAAIIVVYAQGKQKTQTSADYVALGSSYAAGPGIGKRVKGSPTLCFRSSNNYPHQLAQILGMSLTDMSCSGATTDHVLNGGQFFQGPQIDALSVRTKLVTLTIGGNDVDYIGDLATMARLRAGGIRGFLTEALFDKPEQRAERPFRRLENNLALLLQEIRRRAPHARIVVVTYPEVIPVSGTCTQLGISARDAQIMRPVASRLADVTRAVAKTRDATVVDMAALSSGHDVCSKLPWTNGVAPNPSFHPNLAGTAATAQQIAFALSQGRRNPNSHNELMPRTTARQKGGATLP